MKTKEELEKNIAKPLQENEYQLGKYKIILSTSVIMVIEKYIQNDSKKNEAGGVLLGSMVGNTIHVLKASIPNGFDKATRTSFVRDNNVAQVILDFEFANSQDTIFYLGDWHTHPEEHPSPSTQDTQMAHEQFKKSQLSQPLTIMLIRGTKGWYISLYDGKGTYLR